MLFHQATFPSHCSLPQRRRGARSGTGEALAAIDQLAQPGPWETTAAERAVCPEPAHAQSLSSQGEPLAVAEIHLGRGHVALSAELDRSVALAAAEADGEA